MELNQQEESWKLPTSVTPASSIKASQVTEEEEEEVDTEEEEEEDTEEEEEEEEEELATLSSSSSSSCGVLPFSFSSSMTGQTVLERLMQPHTSDASSVSSRRNSHHQSSCSAPPHCFLLGDDGSSRPPFSMSPTHTDDLSKWLLLQQAVHSDQLGSVNHLQGNKSCCQSSSGVRVPPKSGLSMRGWLKDTKERKKEAMRVHTSQVHAALSVAGVAAAVAAIVASTTSLSSLNDDEGGNMNTNKKNNMNMTSSAVASAAALVAAQCVEIAKSMGANHERVLSVLNSAINVKTPGDVRMLTASAATALRAAETLKARAIRNNPSQATVIPYERGCGYPTPHYSSSELGSEDSEVEFGNQDFLRRGHEFLKRTRKGELHWRVLSVYINKEAQVIVKSQGKYMGGTLTKSKKRIVVDVILDIPAWPGRDLLDNASEKKYFGIKTIMGMMELESKNETEYQLWTKGISHLLSLAQHRRVRHE